MKTDLISIARQQIFEEYITKRQKQFDQWMIDADSAWTDKRVKLPYPAFSVYPDEEEIYDRIHLLSTRLTNTQDTQPEVREEEPVKEVVETKLPILLQKRKDIL